MHDDQTGPDLGFPVPAGTAGMLTPEDCLRQRSALGLTVRRLALLAGLTETTVRSFEAGAVQARIGTMVALRKALRAASQQEQPVPGQ